MQTYIATAAFGLEGLVATELKTLGIGQEIMAQSGGARFQGTPMDAMRANLWLRVADRIQLVVGALEAPTFDALFEGVIALPWEQWIMPTARFPVSGHCARSRLMSVSDCQSIAKKAIVERLKRAHRVQSLPETGHEVPVQVAINGDIATLTINTSGQGLSRRSICTLNGEAGLRETLAAAMVKLSPWRAGQALYDPLCGTGTLLVEAAMIAANRAPGLSRTFVCETWQHWPQDAMKTMRREAEAAFTPQNAQGIAGSDIDPQALALCQTHLERAGFRGIVPVTKADIKTLTLPHAPGLILTNPPYGVRLMDKKGVADIARALSALQKQSGRTLSLITGDPAFERAFGRRADKRRRLYNGRLECEALVFWGR